MPNYHDDFREVAHSGGQVTFTMQTDKEGRRMYQVSYSGSSPNPMSLFAVYALPQGVACGDIQLGGIGEPWNPPPVSDCFPVFVASDSEGRFGHECPSCDKYWRSSSAPSRWPMTCPYCGIRAKTYQCLTKAQLAYVEHYTRTLFDALTLEDDASQVTINMDAIAIQTDVPKPEFYYTGQVQQTRFKCSECSAFNDIRGQFGYCSCCGWRNNRAWAEAERQKLRDAMNNRVLDPGQAVKDAVSIFDAAARNFTMQFAEHVPLTNRRRTEIRGILFHSIDRCERIGALFDIDLLAGMDQGDRTFLNMMFHRRHAFEHDGGVATARYMQKSGDGAIHEGDLIRETRENVHRLIGLLQEMTSKFDAGFHEMFPPEEIPITAEKDRQRMRVRTG